MTEDEEFQALEERLKIAQELTEKSAEKEIEKQERVVWITNASLYRLMRTEAETVTIHRQKTKVARIPLVIKGLP